MLIKMYTSRRFSKDFLLRLLSQNFPYAGFPSIAVVSTSVAKISEAGISMMSLERTVKSARFPGVSDPNVDSVNEAYAASRVIPSKEDIQWVN